jgi:hypothetical protein
MPTLLLLVTLPGQVLLAQSSSAKEWALPKDTSIKDRGARVYRFTVVYNNANSKGEVLQRYRLSGEYTRGLADGEVIWNNVFRSDSDGPTGPFTAEQKIAFMEGFRYRNDLASTLGPDFLKGFPAAAVVERNLVWDTGMIEYYGQHFLNKLKLNEAFHVPGADVNMPDVGTFNNRDAVVEWVGLSRRNGQDCALIEYRAFLNPLQIANGGVTLKGRSEYWGQIWVSLATRQIEYGTLYESVTGEVKLPGQNGTQVVNVFRSGVLEPARAR